MLRAFVSVPSLLLLVGAHDEFPGGHHDHLRALRTIAEVLAGSKRHAGRRWRGILQDADASVAATEREIANAQAVQRQVAQGRQVLERG